MTRRACAAALAAVLTATASVLAVQEQRLPGTASVAGITTDADGRPLPRVVLRLSGSTLRGDLLVVSNEDGVFAFSGLPAGRFSLTASRPTYLPASRGSLGSDATAADVLTVEAGQHLDGLRLTLVRGGVISGRITDRYGRPVPHAPVVPMEFRTANGERTLWSLGQQSPPTNSRGEYRLYGLAAGSYLVMAFEAGDYLWFLGRAPGPVPQGGAATSGTDVREMTAADVEWARQQLNSQAANVPGMTTAMAPPPARGSGASQGATYYPGTANPAHAVLVSVRPGEETGGIDFTAQAVPTARISGRVVGPDGRPAANVRLGLIEAGSRSSRPLSDDGSFVLNGVAPGTLTLVATVPGSSLSATHTIVVAGQDMSDLVLVLQAAP